MSFFYLPRAWRVPGAHLRRGAGGSNLGGRIQAGGNPFEGARSRPYPNPAQVEPFGHALFGKAARESGFKPFPQPSGNMTQSYVNPLGVRLGSRTHCGFCEGFGCGNNSKASPQTTILPALVRKSNFSARDNREVTRINLDRSGTRATGLSAQPLGREGSRRRLRPNSLRARRSR